VPRFKTAARTFLAATNAAATTSAYTGVIASDVCVHGFTFYG